LRQTRLLGGAERFFRQCRSQFIDELADGGQGGFGRSSRGDRNIPS
jgi:hypothetical protein